MHAPVSKRNRNRHQNANAALRRFLAALLCICVIVPLTGLTPYGINPLDGKPTENVFNRVSDGDTTDTYQNKLLSDVYGSRYAGRIWTDKSVFAYENGPIMLDYKTDGYNGEVRFNADFGHVFSALASSQRINEYPPSPIDLVILIDMSGSMAVDIVDSTSHGDYNEPDSLRVSHSRIYAVLEAVNKSIQEVMDVSDASRVAVIGYGATAHTLMELGHYTPNEEGKYLEVKNFRSYGGNSAPNSGADKSAAYMVGTVAGLQKLNEGNGDYENYSSHARNDYVRKGVVTADPADTVSIGFHTDLQAGIYQGFEELYKSYKNKDDVTKLYVSQETGTRTVVQRIPVAIVMTDGGSNYALQPTTGGAKGDEWYNVPIYKDNITGYSGNWTKYRTEAAETVKDGFVTENHGGDVTILDILMAASYEKSKVQKKYEKLVLEAKAAEEDPLQDDRFKGTDFRILTVSVDTPQSEWQKPRVYAALDPVHFFSANPQANDGIDPNTWVQKNDVVNAYNHFQNWSGSNDAISHSFTDSDGAKTVTFNQLPAAIEDTDVTKQDVIKNINYNTRFADIKSDALTVTFSDMINEVRGIAFNPLSGDNASGVADSVTYQDPIGEYMKIKNQSIMPNETVSSRTDGCCGKYDMSMLLFGKMHGIVRAGVYDYRWNDLYMSVHPEFGQHGTNKFPMGWYKGEDAASAYKAENLKNDASGSWPAEDPVTGKKYNTAAEAWADGWVMRFDFQTLLDFVPIANAPEGGLPQNLNESVKNTTYTCYRFAETQAERNKLYRNPIFGEVPESLQTEWDDYFKAHNAYPVGMDMYSKFTGVYRLSDIRVWTEYTGDYIDSTGAITPEDNPGYDDSLYINIPVAAVPTQLAEITLGPDGPIAYETNLEDKEQSTPIRLFYAVGLSEDLILRDEEGNEQSIDIPKISDEYASTHTNPSDKHIWFLSNYYSNTVYTGYATKEEPYRTRGDATVTFSPSKDNRYYIFQKPLPLFAHAYRVKDGKLVPVDDADGNGFDKNGAGNGTTTWENGEDPSSWSGGNLIGAYESPEDFNSKLGAAQKDSQGHMIITDCKGDKYILDGETGENDIVFLLSDQMSKADSDEYGNYTDGSKSFSSDDYFFMAVEFYLPTDGVGKDINGVDIPGSSAARKVSFVVARRGSDFGSGIQSENIDNGDMLCWMDFKGNCPLELEYNSRSTAGDNTRGRPTLEKLTLQGEQLRNYLAGCGLDDTDSTRDADGRTALDRDVEYWTSVQNDPKMSSVIAKLKDGTAEFNELFDWSIAARTGGLRAGNMRQFIAEKGKATTDEYYSENVTRTANNYYIPTVSSTAGTGDDLVINNYLGNNGRLEIGNMTLQTTKMFILPGGTEPNADQIGKEYKFQVYLDGATGIRDAIKLLYNEYARVPGYDGTQTGTWQRRISYIDVLTDNSCLLLDNAGERALFALGDEVADAQGPGTPSTPQYTAELVVAATDDAGEVTGYYYANEDGTPNMGREYTDGLESLYYFYLPPNDGTDITDSGETSRRIYQDAEYTGDDMVNSDGLSRNGRTTFYPSGMQEPTPSTEGNRDSYREAEKYGREAGTRTYWPLDAELIPVKQVWDAETVAESDVEPSVSVMALEAEEKPGWQHSGSAGGQMDHKHVYYHPLVIGKPSQWTSEIDFVSPFKTRTMYMTEQLTFGLTDGQELFDDSAVGSVSSKNDLRAHTAQYTLNHGEGLLLTGLNDKSAYRFTEKLGSDIMSQGCTLDEMIQVLGESPEQVKSYNEAVSPGVYSTGGATSDFEQQVHFINTQEFNGSISVLKVGGDGEQLEGAEFNLFMVDDKTGELSKKPVNKEPVVSTFKMMEYLNEGADTEGYDWQDQTFTPPGKEPPETYPVHKEGEDKLYYFRDLSADEREKYVAGELENGDKVRAVAEFRGLDTTKKYKLVEVNPPEGYIITHQPEQIFEYKDLEENPVLHLLYEVKNFKPLNLPDTGSPVVWLTAAFGALVALIGMALMRGRKRGKRPST